MDKLETLREQVLAADVNQIKSIVYNLIDYLVEEKYLAEEKVEVKENDVIEVKDGDPESTSELHTSVPEGVTTKVIDGDIPESTTPVVPAIPVANNKPDANPVPTPHFGV